jgi:hypothetical protein
LLRPVLSGCAARAAWRGRVTHRKHGVVFIAPEPDDECQLCGAVEETRPYGPGGKRVCFDCGMKNPAEAARQFAKMLDGEPQ